MYRLIIMFGLNYLEKYDILLEIFKQEYIISSYNWRREIIKK